MNDVSTTTAPAVKTKKRTRIYIVTRRDNAVEHLVLAGQRAAALSYIAATEYDVRKAVEDDYVRLLPTQRVEDATKKAAVA